MFFCNYHAGADRQQNKSFKRQNAKDLRLQGSSLLIEHLKQQELSSTFSSGWLPALRIAHGLLFACT